MSDSHTKKNIDKPIDLEKLFYEQNIDSKELLKQKESFRKKITSYSLEPYQGEFGFAQKKHLLNRVLFGRSFSDFNKIDGLNFNELFDKIFTEESKFEEPIYDFYRYQPIEEVLYYQRRWGTPEKYLKWVEHGEPFMHINRRLGNGKFHTSLEAWLIKNFVNQDISIHWKLSYFLINLIPFYIGNGGSKVYYEYFLKLFNNCFKNYKDIIYQITLDVGILSYLNLDLSKKENPDENYARELLELYTVGKEGGAKFTESDVKEISKLLTGWHISDNNWDYISIQDIPHSEKEDFFFQDGPCFSWFNPENHDSSNKHLSSYFGNKVIQGREGADGKKELNDLLDVLFQNKDTAKYICRRLYQFFVNPQLNDEIEDKIILPLAEVFISSNFNLAETLKVLLKSEHFFDPENYNSMIKSPYEYFISIFKELHLQYTKTPTAYEPGGWGTEIHEALADPVSRDFYIYSQLFDHCRSCGLDITFPPSVAGWKPYYQKPIYDMFWINTFTLKKRSQITENLIGVYHVYLRGLEGGGNGSDVIQCNLYNYISSIENFKDIDSFIEGITARFLNSEVDDTTKNLLKNTILGELDANYWRNLIEDYENEESHQNYEVLKNRVNAILRKIFQLEEIHTF